MNRIYQVRSPGYHVHFYSSLDEAYALVRGTTHYEIREIDVLQITADHLDRMVYILVGDDEPDEFESLPGTVIAG